MQEGYILIWKIIQKRDFKDFMPFAGKAFYYDLVNKYHKHMKSQLDKYYYLLEVEGHVPWDEEYVRYLFEYEERRKLYNRQRWQKRVEQEKELQQKKEKNHEKYLRSRAKQLEYREANREKLREYAKRYYQENKEKVDAKNRKWFKNNRSKVREYSRKYREEHRERYIETQKKYKESHPNAARESSRRYRENHPRPLKIPGSKLQAPYGLMKGKDKIWILDQKQASVVKMIFGWYLSGKGTWTIVNLLKENRIPSPTGNEVWSSQTVGHILKDERYTGKLAVKPGAAFGKELDEEVVLENYFPRIISDEDFYLAQEERKRKTYRKKD